jgi:hypothetical protein
MKVKGFFAVGCDDGPLADGGSLGYPAQLFV